MRGRKKPWDRCIPPTPHAPTNTRFPVQVAFVGFAVAALVTREGPIACLASHLSNPVGNNIIGSIANLPNVIGK
jgi:hypothetical protein